MKRRLLATLVLTAAATFAGTAAFAYGPDLDLTASAWSNIAGWRTVIPLNNDAGGNLYFDIPVEPNMTCVNGEKCHDIQYLYTTHVPQTISGSLVITLNVATTGNPVFQWFTEKKNVGCTTPAAARPFFWAHNNSWADGDRWWSIDVYYALAPGTVTLTVPLDPAHFLTVFGEVGSSTPETLAWWNAALANVSSIGLTFGGGCYFGHGVYVTGGTARFTLQNYDVVP